ncbi:MAG: GNAT family N-acetyltransferase [Thermoleophilaceae bacterium]
MFAREDWDQLVADHAPPNVLLVATHQAGRVLGYTAAHPEDGEMFLLFVHPTYGGRGVGRTLLSAAHDALRAAGCEQAFPFTHEQNERALSGSRKRPRALGLTCGRRISVRSRGTARSTPCAARRARSGPA